MTIVLILTMLPASGILKLVKLIDYSLELTLQSLGGYIAIPIVLKLLCPDGAKAQLLFYLHQ
jgi:hypothetical protein